MRTKIYKQKISSSWASNTPLPKRTAVIKKPCERNWTRLVASNTCHLLCKTCFELETEPKKKEKSKEKLRADEQSSHWRESQSLCTSVELLRGININTTMPTAVCRQTQIIFGSSWQSSSKLRSSRHYDGNGTLSPMSSKAQNTKT